VTPSRKHPSATFWATVAVVCLPLLYVLCFGPACWLTAQPWQNVIQNDGFDMPPRWMQIYRPFGIILNKGNSPAKNAVSWWATIGVKRTSCAVVPFGSGRHDRAAAAPPNAEFKF
jgi:hypothetical protein